MLSDNMLSAYKMVLSDNMLSDNIMIKADKIMLSYMTALCYNTVYDNIVLSYNMLSYLFLENFPHSEESASALA
jgi:hypothetical protein